MRPGPDHQAAADDYTDDQPRGSRSKGRSHDSREDGGPIGALSNDVLGMVPGLG
jgi:hypothetical protein